MELSPLYGVSHWRKQLFPYTVILIIEGASGGPGRKEKMRMLFIIFFDWICVLIMYARTDL